MNLPRRVVTLLLLSVLLSAGSGIYAYVALRGVSQRQEKLQNKVNVLKAIGKVGKYFSYLSSLPSKMTAHPERETEYYEDLNLISKEVGIILERHAGEFQEDLGREWEAYLEKLKRILPQIGSPNRLAQKAIDEVENDEYLQMDMLLERAVKQEEDETGEILLYVRGANRKILTFLALGLVMGLVLAGGRRWVDAAHLRRRHVCGCCVAILGSAR